MQLMSRVSGTDGTLKPVDGCAGGNAIFAWVNQERDGGYEGRVCNPYQGKSFQQVPCGQQVCPAPLKCALALPLRRHHCPRGFSGISCAICARLDASDAIRTTVL